MGYGYFFLIGLPKLPTEFNKILREENEKLTADQIDDNEIYERLHEEIVEPFLREMGLYFKDLYDNWENYGLPECPWFIRDVGTKQHGPSSSYSCGGADEELTIIFKKVAEKYPGAAFDIYHCHFDFTTMTVYTFTDGVITSKTTTECQFKHGDKIITNRYSLTSMYDDVEITQYLNPGREVDGEYNFERSSK